MTGRMKKAERQKLIVAELAASPAVRISTMARKLAVSTETLRRDLDDLTRRGLVARTYGGAASVASQPPFADRRARSVTERARIGHRAAGLVEAGATVMIDSGTTTVHLAQALVERDLPLTVITNSFGVAGVLVEAPRIRVLFAPGDVSRRERGAYGPETSAFLSRFHADIAFIGASGLTVDGPTDVESGAAWVKRAMIARAARRVLLVDHTKFHRRHLERVCGLDEIDAIVTDAVPDALLAEALTRAGVELAIAEAPALGSAA